jgi:hypothetical protein
MRFLSSVTALGLALGLAMSAPAISADYAREKNWANEVTPSVMTGDPVWLELSGGHKFLTLFTEAGDAKAGVIVVHGMGVHPDWGLIGPLRQNLPDKGLRHVVDPDAGAEGGCQGRSLPADLR